MTRVLTSTRPQSPIRHALSVVDEDETYLLEAAGTEV